MARGEGSRAARPGSSLLPGCQLQEAKPLGTPEPAGAPLLTRLLEAQMSRGRPDPL